MIHINNPRFSHVVLLSTLLAGCSLAPAYEKPPMALPAQLGPAAVQASDNAIALDWWKGFSSPELDSLMTTALAANKDLVAAFYRVEQARAAVKGARSFLMPSIDASADASRNYSKDSNGRKTSFNNSGADITAHYEIDLWGRLRNQLSSEKSTFRASQFDREAILLIVEADVATTYAQALATKDRLVIAQRNIDAARDILSLVEAQYNAGAISGLELAQQRAALAAFEADIPALQFALATTISALAVLTGNTPQDFQIAGENLASLNLPAIAPVQPSALLERRPDIARAEASLMAANADIGVARAAFFPSLDISASLVFSDILTGGISRLASLGGQLAAPIFEGGRLHAEVDRTKARFGELEANYQQTVLNALKDAYDTLVAVEAAEKQVEDLDVASVQSARALELARLRYQYGATGFQTVLEAQRTALSAQDRLVQQKFAQFSAAISLYKALGGGWNKSAADVETSGGQS